MFDPFPIATLRTLGAPAPGGLGWGYGLLPLLRWLRGHGGWRHAAIVEDGRSLWAPVLQQAAMEGVAIPCTRLDADTGAWGDAPGPFDFVHVTAECPADLLRQVVAVLPRCVSQGGMVLFGQPSAQGVDHEGGLSLPIGDGSLLVQPHGPPSPVMAWLQSRDAAGLRELAQLFDGLGTHATLQLDLADVRARAAQLAARDASETALRERLDGLLAHARHLQGVIGQLSAERDAACAPSWRAALSLRLRTAKRACAAALSSAPAAAAPIHAGLAQFLAGTGRLVLPSAAQPVLTVLLMAEGEAAPLFACLGALAASGLDGKAEVVVAANGCGEEAARLLARVDGARILPTDAFLAALRVAAGAFILLLDSRMQPRPGAISAALATLQVTPGAGAMCGKLFNAAGAIVQAGETVDAAGTLHGRGAGLPVTAPEVQYRCPVMAGPASFLLVRGRLLRQLGGLGPFVGTAHAGADLCLRLRAAGWGTVYEPAAEVLADPVPAPTEPTLFALRHAVPTMEGRRLLIIDDRVPYPALGAGYPRAARMVHELHRLGWRITFFPNHEPFDDWGSIYRQFPREVEFMLGYGRDGLGHLLHTRGNEFDTVVVSRPHNMRDYLAARHATRPRRLVYDAEAVFATREFLRLERAGCLPGPAQRQAMLDEEIGLTATADIVTAVNAAEAELFGAAGCPDVRVLGLGTEPAPIPNGLAQRRDLLFVGALGEDNSPNADGVAWFVREVMPLLDAHIGTGYRLLVAGRCRAPKVLALASGRVEVLGLVDDLTPLYATARAFVAPTRYAAGVPLKVQESVGRGLPVVGTVLLARQLGWAPERDMLAADTAEAFAACCARLYTDPALWYALRRQGLDTLVGEARLNDFGAVVEAIFGRA